MYSETGRRYTPYRKCLDGFARLSSAELAGRQKFIDRAANELGLHADRLRAGQDELGSFRMDLFPRILRAREWQAIEAGIRQRVRAFSDYIRDIYGPKDILRAGVIPPELVFEDPSFHPELHGIPIAGESPVTVGAIDLIRSQSGEWQVLENRFSSPTGISHVIQARRIQAQAVPELFESLPVYPVASFATRLSEALAELAPAGSGGQPLVVLLSEGESGRHFFEESFLARHMGIPLTRPEDLIVRDGRVFLRTIRGLLQVNLIYRRLEPPDLDPVAFASASQNGIPGLIQCVRRGTIRVVNALGCAVADNRSLLRHSDDLIRHYTGEQPILRTVPTYHGYDTDQIDWIRDNLGSLLLKTVSHPETLARTHPEAGELVRKGRLQELLRTNPRLVVAQQLPPASLLPVFGEKQLALEPVVLRVFCITGKRPYVLPGGLSRLAIPGNERLATGKAFHALKDTWVLNPEKRAAPRSGSRLEPGIRGSEFPLPSRAAEAFYWMGRYLERGSGTARMLKTLDELRWSELTPGERELYAPLWEAILEATGEAKSRSRRGRISSEGVFHQLLVNADNAGSARACFRSVQLNANSIRSFITPELWNGIRKAGELFPPHGSAAPSGPVFTSLMQSLAEAGDAITGTAHRTLLRDSGWQFLNTGIALERGLNNVVILSVVLPHIAKRQWQHLRDDTDLTALLRLLGALDAYHRKYRSRAYLDRVAALLWMAPDFTGSVRFTASSLLHNLAAINLQQAAPDRVAGLEARTARFINWLGALSLETMFPARTLELDKGLTRSNLTADATISAARKSLGKMRKFYESFHVTLEDLYFSHHAIPAPEDS